MWKKLRCFAILGLAPQNMQVEIASSMVFSLIGLVFLSLDDNLKRIWSKPGFCHTVFCQKGSVGE